MVLQKQYGNWTVASVWLGSEIEKPMPELPKHKPPPCPSRDRQDSAGSAV